MDSPPSSSSSSPSTTSVSGISNDTSPSKTPLMTAGLKGEVCFFNLQSSSYNLHDLETLFEENVAAKIYRVAAQAHLEEGHPTAFPEEVPQSGPNSGTYICRDVSFWTSGFFPGNLYLLLERLTIFPSSFSFSSPNLSPSDLTAPFLEQCKNWSTPLQTQALRKDTHDLGFVLLPALRLDYALTGNRESLDTIITAAHSLASRFSPTVQAIRSWDTAVNSRYSYTSMSNDFLVIIDSMANLELLFFAAAQSGDRSLSTIATAHARTLLRTHIRAKDHSTSHLVNFDPPTGYPKQTLTNQGYRDDSTWSRGQAWAILGYAQTYLWTKDTKFLEATIGLVTYFVNQLKAQELEGIPGPWVPVWDFDAPRSEITEVGPLRDSSAGVIAANGMLILYQGLMQAGRAEEAMVWLDNACRIVRETIKLCGAKDRVVFTLEGSDIKTKAEQTGGRIFDALLRNATVNWNEWAVRRYADHGLVYADYYLIEFGNRLLRMGLY